MSLQTQLDSQFTFLSSLNSAKVARPTLATRNIPDALHLRISKGLITNENLTVISHSNRPVVNDNDNKLTFWANQSNAGELSPLIWFVYLGFVA